VNLLNIPSPFRVKFTFIYTKNIPGVKGEKKLQFSEKLEAALASGIFRDDERLIRFVGLSCSGSFKQKNTRN